MRGRGVSRLAKGTYPESKLSMGIIGFGKAVSDWTFRWRPEGYPKNMKKCYFWLAPPTLETSGIFLDSTLPQLQKSDRKWEWGANLGQCPISTWWYQHDMWNQLTETDCLIFLRLQGPLVKWRCLSLSFWCLKCWNASYDNGRRPSPLALPLSSTVCSTKTLITLYPATASKCYAKVFFPIQLNLGRLYCPHDTWPHWPST